MDTDESQKDAIPEEGQSSPDEQKSSEELNTLKEAIDKEADKRHSKLDRAKNVAEKRATDAETRFTNLQKQNDDMELQVARDNPEALTSIEAKRRIRETQETLERDKSEFEAKKSEYDEVIEKAKEASLKANAKKIADKYEGVTASDLLEFTDGSDEKMEALARKMAASKPPEKSGIEPDSGLASGKPGDDAYLDAYNKGEVSDHKKVDEIHQRKREAN